MRKNYLINVWSVVIALGLCGCGAFSLRHSLREGEAALKDRNYETAIRHLSRAAARIPNDEALQFNLAMAHYHLGSFFPAETALERVLELKPDDPDAIELQGYIALQRGEWARARERFGKVLSLAPAQTARILCALSNVERGDMNPDLARVRLLRALSADWKYAPAHYNLAMLYHDHFNLVDEAIDELELYRRMANSDDPQMERAMKTLESLSRLRLARQPKHDAGARDSEQAGKLVKEANRAAATRQWSQAEKTYRAALAADPLNAAAAYGLGTALNAQRRRSEAFEAYALATGINPDFADAYHQGAQLALELNKFADAATLLHRAAARWPKRDNFFALLTSLRSTEGNLAGARAYGEYYLLIAPPGEQRRKYEIWLKSLPK